MSEKLKGAIASTIDKLSATPDDNVRRVLLQNALAVLETGRLDAHILRFLEEQGGGR